jgi:hypothetical protein
MENQTQNGDEYLDTFEYLHIYLRTQIPNEPLEGNFILTLCVGADCIVWDFVVVIEVELQGLAV